MSVDLQDVKPSWKRYYRSKVRVPFKWIANNPKRLRGYKRRAAFAIRQRELLHDLLIERLGNFDNAQSERYRTSEYEDHERLSVWCGEQAIDRIWFQVPAWVVDKTCYDRKFEVKNLQGEVDEDWYTKSPSQFNKVHKVLTPWAEQRQYGRVYFGTETRYIIKEKVLPPAVKDQVKGYYKDKKVKIFAPYKRTPRSVLYHPPKTGTSRYRSRKYKYSHTGTGILKTRTKLGRYCYHWIQRKRYLEEGIENKTIDHQDSVGAIYFAELRACHYDWERWISTIQSTDILTQEEKEVYEENKSRARRLLYYPAPEDIFLTLSVIRNKIFARRIQRVWRKKERLSEKYKRIATVIQKSWRTYMLRSLGTTRTIIGSLQ
jgi:hypothetical protein